jgi:transmembrane sensor
MLREALTQERLSGMPPDEAAAYFVTRRAEGLTESEQALLAGWLAADQTHARALDRLERGWAMFDAADGDEILDALRAHAVQARPGRWWRWPGIVAVAAMLCLAMVTSLLFVPSLRQRLIEAGHDKGGAWTQYATAHDQVRSILLADGSTMTLDAESIAQARFDTGERSIRLLRGRGFFEVRKDAARPFAVTAADRRVVALGTRFDVDVTAGTLQVTLHKGRVAVEPLVAGKQAVFLDPGQQFIERDDTDIVRTVRIGREDQPDWSRGLVDLDDTPLREAAAQINRHSHDQIVIRDAAVARIRISGQFRAGDAARFAGTISELYPLRAVRRDGEIELVARK